MKIKKLTEGSTRSLLDNLKNDFNGLKKYYHSHSKLDFKPITEGMDLVQSGSYSLEASNFRPFDNQIVLETDGTGKFDFENAKKIYELFKDLTPADANDSRLWVRLTHDHCHDYMVKRWMDKPKSEKVVLERFFYLGSGQSARVRNGVARLWWIAHLTVQKNETEDSEKWMYTKAICESQDFITSILERTMGTYENVRFGVLEYYLENKDKFGSSKSKKIQHILRDLNNYGGVNLLPLMSKDDVKEIVSGLV